MTLHTLHIPRSTMTVSQNLTKSFSLNLFTPRSHFPPNTFPHFPRFHHRLTKTHCHHKTSHSSFSFTPFASLSSSPSPKSGFVGWYLRNLESHPILIKSVTSSFIFAAADFTAQMITLPSSFASYDWKRTCRMAVYGLLILGPSQHMWFSFMSKIIPNTDVSSTLKKILMGQAVFGPIMNTVFFSYNGAALGENGSEIIARLKRDLLPALLGGAVFWPACDFVTFKFIPVHLQPLLNSCCAYIWTIYLTYMANRPSASNA
ncbi:hypothetical protein RJT34_26577 [Clitoria ternatea]|uniref:Uncharacterized protein n=1 Tax=Clitoria ternatea TaxID=43366 RepID=A0AAN9FC02_CLITE